MLGFKNRKTFIFRNDIFFKKEKNKKENLAKM
jgi:hypothetical protein